MATVHKILTDLERVNEDEPFIASSNTKTRETTGATTQNIRMKTQIKLMGFQMRDGQPRKVPLREHHG